MNTLELLNGTLLNMNEVILIQDTVIYMAGGFQIKLKDEDYARSIKDCFHNIMDKEASIKYSEETNYYVEHKVAFQDEFVDKDGNWWNKSINVTPIRFLKTTIVGGQKNIDYLNENYQRKFGTITAGNCIKFSTLEALIDTYVDHDIYFESKLAYAVKKAYQDKQYATDVDLVGDINTI